MTMAEPTGISLSFMDRFLTLWIFGAMSFGVGLGHIFTGVENVLNAFSVSTTNIPIGLTESIVS
jgi:ACR3 family arsenite transporter